MDGVVNSTSTEKALLVALTIASTFKVVMSQIFTSMRINETSKGIDIKEGISSQNGCEARFLSLEEIGLLFQKAVL